ncbi:MAG: C4-type zinc ribbon domain-containing protein [Spirochaetes bacterium]|nr:C4-type zinc ribbon domain-containing protein [Spirochaetota bacterium]
MIINEVYDKLLNYQSILTEKFKLEEKKSELPKVLSSKNEVLNRIKKAYLSKYNQFKKLEENINVYHRRMNEMKLKQQELEEKTKFVKSQREYEALDREVGQAKQREDEYQFQLMQDQRIIEDLRNAIENYELSMKQQEEEITKETERVDSEVEKIKEKLDELKGQEETIVNDLDEGFRYKFEKIVKNKEGFGIVSILKGFCNGCHLVLPSEFINKVRSGNDIYFCPYCSRVLYYEETNDNIFALEEEEMDDDEFFEMDD